MATAVERGSVQFHGNVWQSHAVFSLSSPFSEPHYLKVAQSLAEEIKGMISLRQSDSASSSDIIEQLMVVDALQCLALDRHFRCEIQNALDHVYRHWDESKGIVTSDSDHPHLLSTSLAFTLLRRNRYKITPRPFESFRTGNSSFRLEGLNDNDTDVEIVKSVLALLRASFLAFHGDTVLHAAEKFSTRFLSDWLAKNTEHVDSNIQDPLVKQVKHVLDFPTRCSPPIWESRCYIDIYSANDDWLTSKTNQKILQLAKLEFNTKQAIYQQEMKDVISWWSQDNVPKYSFLRARAIESYFMSVLGAPDPELSHLRRCLTQSYVTAYALDDTGDNYATADEYNAICQGLERWDITFLDGSDYTDELKGVFRFAIWSLDQLLARVSPENDKQVCHRLRQEWLGVAKAYLQENIWNEQRNIPTLDEYFSINLKSSGVTALLSSTLPCIDAESAKQDTLHPFYSNMFYLADLITRLTDDIGDYVDVDTKKEDQMVNLVVSHQKQYPEASVEETIVHLQRMLDDAWMEINQWQFEDHHDLPVNARAYFYNVCRSISFILRMTDGFTKASTIVKDQMTKIFVSNV